MNKCHSGSTPYFCDGEIDQYGTACIELLFLIFLSWIVAFYFQIIFFDNDFNSVISYIYVYISVNSKERFYKVISIFDGLEIEKLEVIWNRGQNIVLC